MRELLPPPSPSPEKPLVLGLLGGIASGKSTVARDFEAEGFLLIEADQIAKELLQEPQVIKALIAHFGRKILKTGGVIDRKKLADLVFNQQSERVFLEKLLHPKVRDKIRKELKQASDSKHPSVLDVPLLLEGGLFELCDVLVFISVDEVERRKRAMARGMDPKDWAARETIQAPLERKLAISHFEIDNSQGEQKTKKQVQALLERLKRLGFI